MVEKIPHKIREAGPGKLMQTPHLSGGGLESRSMRLKVIKGVGPAQCVCVVQLLGAQDNQ